eukprot:CAMPEP_0115857888 /NCGR_PEP_ID=MMETSP0287-20121206/15810_1 /TAXON_ID=412157 /ORGANISM="Chrysochromulina rotalis, Strain UIO044" /LENGTH=70 /DNA_ID=CAMNT_0003312127 /DNA_START=524 /DNA_END=737 /DNA_ORIENTATION=+
MTPVKAPPEEGPDVAANLPEQAFATCQKEAQCLNLPPSTTAHLRRHLRWLSAWAPRHLLAAMAAATAAAA